MDFLGGLIMFVLVVAGIMFGIKVSRDKKAKAKKAKTTSGPGGGSGGPGSMNLN